MDGVEATAEQLVFAIVQIERNGPWNGGHGHVDWMIMAQREPGAFREYIRLRRQLRELQREQIKTT